MSRVVHVFLPVLAALLLSGCDMMQQRSAEAQTSADLERLRTQPGYIIDTVHTPQEEMRRFRVGLSAVDELRHAAPSRDEAVARLFHAFASADTAAIRALHIDVEEFAFLYFPHSPYVTPKHQLPPGLVWFQITSESNKGSARAIRALSGGTVLYQSYQCKEEPEPWGTGRLWSGCTVHWRDEAGKDWDLRLFGSILEYDGGFKFVSYANKL